MSSTICAGCNQSFTYSGYSHHLSLTSHSRCCALYVRHLGLSTASNSPGVSGQEDADSSGRVSPELGGSSE